MLVIKPIIKNVDFLSFSKGRFGLIVHVSTIRASQISFGVDIKEQQKKKLSGSLTCATYRFLAVHL